VADYSQQSFVGGMNMSVDDTRLGEDEYKFAKNIRNRFGTLEGIKNVNDISSDIGAFTSNPPIQAIYSIGEFVFLFFNGGCKYRKPLNPDSTWVVLCPGGTMDRSAEIFVQAVPASTQNFLRKETNVAGASLELDMENAVQRTVAAIIVQDGINQPKIIEITGGKATDRVSKNYAEWIDGTYTSREYIPIGKQMAFFNNKLFVVSTDGTEIYHSVSGRPMDFVVAITTDGHKINSDETIGGAPATSYTVGYNVITALSVLNNEALFVSTVGGSYGVSLDYTLTVFAEPMFKKQYLFTANSINQHSFVDLLGDFAFIDPEGLRSFNAVMQSKNEGRNSIFSLKVARLFKGVVQETKKCAAIVFDDYALFACNTIFGHGILIFDTLTKQFVSFDQLTDDSNSNIGPVINFAKVETNNKRELFAITHGTTTSSGEPAYKCVKLFEGSNYATAYVETRAFCTNDTRVEQKPQELRLLFSKVQSASSVTATQRVNDETTPDTSAGSQAKTLAAQVTPITFPVTLATVWSGPKQIQNLLYNFQGGQQGWKVSYALKWTNGINLSNIQLQTRDITPMNPMLSQAYVS
jgi:hypothetical protein